MTPSGKNRKDAKTSGSKKAIKTGEFKAAKTSPIVKASDEELETKGALKAPAEPAPAAAAAADSADLLLDQKLAEVTDKVDAAVAAASSEPAPAAAEPAPAVPASEAETEPARPVVRVPSGKAKATSARGPAVAAAARTTSSKRAAVSPLAAPAAPRVGSGAEIWIICRECHEEWTIDPARARSQETIACPICEHRAQAPTDDVIHQIALYKGIEQKNLTLALASFVVGVFAMVLWTVLTSNPSRAQEFAVFTLPLVVAGLSLIATFAFMAKYEGSRWETYF